MAAPPLLFVYGCGVCSAVSGAAAGPSWAPMWLGLRSPPHLRMRLVPCSGASAQSRRVQASVALDPAVFADSFWMGTHGVFIITHMKHFFRKDEVK